MQRSMPQKKNEEEKEERRKKRTLERKRERKKERRRRREEKGMLVTKRAAWGSGSGVSTGTLAFVEGTTRRRSGGQKKGDGSSSSSSSLPRLHWRQEEREKKEIVSRTSVLGQFSWRKRVDNLLAKYHY